MNISEDEVQAIVDLATKVNGYYYSYNSLAESLGEDATPRWFGILAQELQKVPGIQDAVKTGEDGFLRVDTRRLALYNTALLSTLSKLLLESIKKAKTEEAEKVDTIIIAEGG